MKYHITKIGNVYVTDERGVPRDCQPVAVVSFEDREQVEVLAVAYRSQPDWHTGYMRDSTNAMQAALREFANPTPPKPDEPTGLGAVVEDERGELWVRRSVAPHWNHAKAEAFPVPWTSIAAVKVLSEGVTS